MIIDANDDDDYDQWVWLAYAYDRHFMGPILSLSLSLPWFLHMLSVSILYQYNTCIGAHYSTDT